MCFFSVLRIFAAVFIPIFIFMYSNKEIWKVSYPILLGLLAQNVINVTDTAFLGHIGEVELGAAAMGGLLYICMYTIAFGFSTGAQILIARRNGEGRFHEVGPIVMQGGFFLFMLALLTFLLMLGFAPALIRLIVSSDVIYNATNEFMYWRMWGFFFSFVNVIFRALYIGVTRTKVLTMNAVVMALINVGLDYAMIFGHFGFPVMGLKGAALASVIAEGCSLLFFLIYTRLKVDRKKYGFYKAFHLNWDMQGKILGISSFTMLQYFLSMSVWFIFFMAIERLGQRDLAIANIVRSIYIVLLIPVQALSTTANTLVSNLIGAGGVAHVLKLLRKITLISFVIVSACVAVLYIAPELFLSIYTSDPALIEASIPSIYVVGAGMIVSSIGNVYFSGVSGTGNTQAALWLESFTLVIYALYIFWVGWYLKASVSICFTTELVYYSLLFITSFVYFKKAKWQNKKI